eukprot:COSAG02_NODE_3538_length_6591_cov_2.343038_6_plen_147_part_00
MGPPRSLCHAQYNPRTASAAPKIVLGQGEPASDVASTKPGYCALPRADPRTKKMGREKFAALAFFTSPRSPGRRDGSKIDDDGMYLNIESAPTHHLWSFGYDCCTVTGVRSSHACNTLVIVRAGVLWAGKLERGRAPHNVARSALE